MSSRSSTSAWHRLEKGIITGYTMSVSLFALAMTMLVKSAKECRGRWYICLNLKLNCSHNKGIYRDNTWSKIRNLNLCHEYYWTDSRLLCYFEFNQSRVQHNRWILTKLIPVYVQYSKNSYDRQDCLFFLGILALQKHKLSQSPHKVEWATVLRGRKHISEGGNPNPQKRWMNSWLTQSHSPPSGWAERCHPGWWTLGRRWCPGMHWQGPSKPPV